MLSIYGDTKIFGIIGNPIEHSLSPIIHNYFARVNKQNLAYCPFLVGKQNLKAALDGALALGICGLNVTVPFKQDVCSLIGDIDEEALKIGAVNTLVNMGNYYKGFNTDIYGLSQTFKNHNIQIEGKTIIIIGAGGSAYTAAFMSAANRAAKIIIVNRTKKNAANLAEHINKYYNIKLEILNLVDINNINDADILIQTTPVGMSSFKQLSPINDNGVLSVINTVVDIIYNPTETVLLKEAKQKGALTINGFDMLLYQAAKSFELWTNQIVFHEDILGIAKIISAKLF